VALAIDIVFAVIPFVPTGAGQVIKVGNKIDNALDVSKAIGKIDDFGSLVISLNRFDNIGDMNKITFIGRNMKRVENTSGLLGKADNIYVAWKKYDSQAKGIKKFFHNFISAGHNGGWLFGKLRKGYTVFDIGITTAHKGFGLWYGVERFVLALWETRNIWKLPANYFL
jgi:hypothetical protein